MRYAIAGAWVALAALGTSNAWGGPWRLSGDLSVRETYTNNVSLSSSTGGQGRFVTTVQPIFNLRKTERGRINANASWAPQFRMEDFFDNTRINQRFNGVADAELISDFAFLDLRGSIFQQNVFAGGTLASDTVSRTGNLTTTYTYSISPHIRNHWGSIADSEVRYTNDGVFRPDSISRDSIGHTFLANIDSGRRFSLLPWDAFGSWRQIDYLGRGVSANSTVTFRRVQGQIGTRWTRKFLPFVYVGYDDDEFFLTNFRDTSGIRYGGGVTWTPNRRTELTLGYGDQYTGSAPIFNLSYQSKRIAVRAGYNQDLSESRGQALRTQGLPLEDEFGDPVLDPAGLPLDDVSTATSTPSSQVFLLKRLNASVSARGRRTTVTAKGFSQEREFALGNTESAYGASLRANRRISRVSNVNASFSWTPRTFQLDPGRKDTRWIFRVGLNRRFARSLTGGLSYRFQQNDSNDPTREFTEHRVEARVAWNFWGGPALDAPPGGVSTIDTVVP